MKISVVARSSPLSQVQANEVLQMLPSHIHFETHFISSTGDLDLKTSLRTLDKTDFFTREIDALVLNGKCRIAIHSAKDLPESNPDGLTIIAITRGIDPSDSLVMREFDSFETLKPGSIIATSSIRREEIVKTLRSDLAFRDLRGTIQKRLELLDHGDADGIVVAEAALLRLNLAHLNRIRLPGETTPLQGQLAILAKLDDEEMHALFSPLDSRKYPKALYLGPEYPGKAFPDRHITHFPLIETKIRTPFTALSEWNHYTHIIFTSKTAVRLIVSLLRKNNISLSTLLEKTILTVGEATGELIAAFGAYPLIAKEESAEGIVTLLKDMDLQNAHVFWPHSSLSRPLIESTLREKKVRLTASILYDTKPTHAPLPALEDFQEILFSSPSTVSAFFAACPKPPPHLRFTPIGKITANELAKVNCCS